MLVCRIGELALRATEHFDLRVWGLLFGPRPFLAHGANPALLQASDRLDVPASQKLFNLYSNEDLVGSVLVDEINPFHRRAGFHVAILPEFQRQGLAKTGLLLVGALFGDIWGFEYFYTYAVPRSPGSDLAAEMGLQSQGLLTGYSLTPEGRGDMLLMGGLWSELRQLHKSELDQIRWGDEQ